MIKILHNKKFEVVQKITTDSRERYIIFILQRNGNKYFYKELNNKDSDRFEGQLDFQKKIETSSVNIILPKLYDYDLKSEKKWGLWQYLEGKCLAQWQPKNIQDLEKWFGPITNLLIELEKIKSFKEEYNIADKMVEKVEKWSNALIEGEILSLNDRDKIINLVKKTRQKIITGFNHGDFVPWHMYEVKFPKFALVDYENWKNRPKYYDLAYFYHRVYTKLNEPKLANKFLSLYKEKVRLPQDFNERFLPVLGERVIGGFHDHLVSKDGTDIKTHKKLLQDLLKSTPSL